MLTDRLSSSTFQVRTILSSAGKRKQRELPPGAGGNILGGRNTGVGKDLKDGYTAP